LNRGLQFFEMHGPVMFKQPSVLPVWLAQAAGPACKECTKAPLPQWPAPRDASDSDANDWQNSNLPQWLVPRHGLCINPSVIRIVETLLKMQGIELESRRLTPEQEEQAGKLRAQIPAAVLERFDRLVGRGKRAVAIVRNGVCCECHLRLPSGTLAALAYTTELHYCDNCTRILYLPEDEPLGLTKGAPSAPAAVKPTVKRSRKRASPRVV